MSTTHQPAPRPPQEYTGPERYARVAEDFLGVTLTRQQRRIHRAVGDHRRVLVEAGNGPGKSFGVAALNGAFLLRHPDSINIATSGTYSQLADVLWKPLRRLWRRNDLPGECLASPPRIRVDDEWYFKATSPRNPGDLEGRHAGAMLVTIEEADKPAISAEHIDSAESMLTGERDRMVVVANPPSDESNVVADLRDDPHWHHVQLSTLDSRNVRVDAGELDAARIPGITGLPTIREDWERWHDREWPGLDAARTAHQRRDDLDERWYRRRAGVMPPDNASVYRPWDASMAKAAFADAPTGFAADTRPVATGIDVAGPGSDRTVLLTLYRNGDLAVRYTTRDTDYPGQETAIMDRLGNEAAHPVAVDAAGEGSGLADYLADRIAECYRFGSDKTPTTDEGLATYKDQRTEALAALGDALPDARYADRDLREELVIAARTIEFDAQTLQSRGTDGEQVAVANSKSAITDRLGRSPDVLDAAMMAVWARDCVDSGGEILAFQM